MKTLAETVQVYSPDGQRVLNALEGKVKEYSLTHEEERRDFWVDVTGMFLRKECYVELERFKNNEIYHRNLEVFFSLGKNNSTVKRTYEWITTLPKLEEYICGLLEYCDELDESFVTAEAENEKCTADSLRFWYSIVNTKGNTDKVLFYYIPLVLWALENLLIYGKYSQKYNGFLLNKFIPVMRKHRAAANQLMELIENEPYGAGFEKSKLFTQDYPFTGNFIDDPEESVDMFTAQLAQAFRTNNAKAVDVEDATKLRQVNPLYCMYRALLSAEQLNLEEDYAYIVPSNIALQINRQFEVQYQTYSQENIKYIILAPLNEIINSPIDSFLRNIDLWEKAEETIASVLENLLKAGVLTTESGIEVRQFMRSNKTKIFRGMS